MSLWLRVLVMASGLIVSNGTTARVAAAQPVDQATLAAIRDEGLSRSQAMDHVSWLSDVYGPRVTGTPAHIIGWRWMLPTSLLNGTVIAVMIIAIRHLV